MNNATKLMDLLKRTKEKAEINKDRTIIIDRVQVNVNNPAIAQVVVIFPDDFSQEKIDDFFKQFHEKYNNRNIVKKFLRTENGCMVEIESNKFMYKWFEILIVDYNSYLKKNFPEFIVKVRGKWDKFDELF